MSFAFKSGGQIAPSISVHIKMHLHGYDFVAVGRRDALDQTQKLLEASELRGERSTPMAPSLFGNALDA